MMHAQIARDIVELDHRLDHLVGPDPIDGYRSEGTLHRDLVDDARSASPFRLPEMQRIEW